MMYQNKNTIPDFDVVSIVEKDKKKIEEQEKLQQDYLKRNKVKSYGVSTDKYELVKSK